MNQDATNSTETALPGEPQVRRSAGLEALFEQYVAADMEAREISERLLTESRAFQEADRRQLEAWKKYKAAKDQCASNADLRQDAGSAASNVK